MFVIIKGNEGGELMLNKRIFSRPTPWREAVKAVWSLFLSSNPYQCVFLPPSLSEISGYDIDYENGEVLFRKGTRNVLSVTPFPLTGRVFFLGILEALLHGTVFRVWDWRWQAGVLTRRELQTKVEHLEEQLRRLTEGLE